ncbi:MAG TPA: FAD-binding oxidoreductase [Candidatus Ozemobacteraceae bacterium]|nr:FAD-binding oxidoreductase [Candidatus Ozemobacteraceae bacterium]
MTIITQNPNGQIRPEFQPLGAQEIQRSFSPYLSDESRMQGQAEAITFPQSEAEIAASLQAAAQAHEKVTVSGGRTGVVGGAVPPGGWILSVERLAQIERFRFDDASGEYRLHTGPGLTLDKLRRALRSAVFPFSAPPDVDTQRVIEQYRREASQWMFAPDPTEPSAQLGGMAASNASGAKTYRYGPMRAHVRGLRVVLAGGRILHLERGQHLRQLGQSFTISDPGGVEWSVPVPGYQIPHTKHAAGFYAAPQFDLIDLFIGSEGTLGIISELELALVPVKGCEAQLVAFFPDAHAACHFVCRVRQNAEAERITVEAIEYMCDRSLTLLRRGAGAHFRQIPDDGRTGVFLDLRFAGDPTAAWHRLAQWLRECGSSEDSCLSAMGAVHLAQVKEIRHALPESVNHRISEIRAVHPQLTKLGTDMAVPDEHLNEVMELYAARLTEAGLQHVIFGHIGNNHLHVNILPETPAQYERGKALYKEFAASIVKMNGSVSAEHGIGKLKRYLLEYQFSTAALAEMKAIKAALDPDFLLGPETLF